MKKAIISGADGFVGSYTVGWFLRQGIDVLALDIGATPRRLVQTEGLTYVQCDVADTQAMRARRAPASVRRRAIIADRLRGRRRLMRVVVLVL